MVDSSSEEEEEEQENQLPTKETPPPEFELSPSNIPERVTSRSTFLRSEDVGLLSQHSGGGPEAEVGENEEMMMMHSYDRDGYLTHPAAMMTEEELLESATGRMIMQDDNAILNVY